MYKEKVVSIENLSQKIEGYHAAGKKIVQCHGDFDLLHVGHIRHLQQAKSRGDVLVVTITPDRYVNKGPHRPVFSESMRAEAVAALDFVDLVAINRWPSAVEAIQVIKPDIFAKGTNSRNPQYSYLDRLAAEEAAVKAVGGEAFYTEDISFSSSGLINRYLPVFPREVSDYLLNFRAAHSLDEVIRFLQDIRRLKVLTIGETIIDEYQYCHTLGKSDKEPILAAQYVSSEVFAGGILAVANNTAAFCDQVGVLTLLGEYDSYEQFIYEKIDPKVRMMFHFMKDAPTIVKRRFVELYPFQKLFEVYIMDDQISPDCIRALYSHLSEILPDYDLVIVTDYGHGMLSAEIIDLLSSQSKFLAINTQTNAANRGFNTVSKYSRANYICISEAELRLEVRNRRRDLKEIIQEVAENMHCQRMLITRGLHGNLVFDKESGFFECPALTNQIRDRVGAGDTVLAVTSPCVALGVPMDVVGFIGNAVGAQAVTTVGHREYVGLDSLTRYIQSLLQ
jgi:rfaE bifunctional protein kinase chain/domain